MVNHICATQPRAFGQYQKVRDLPSGNVYCLMWSTEVGQDGAAPKLRSAWVLSHYEERKGAAHECWGRLTGAAERTALEQIAAAGDSGLAHRLAKDGLLKFAQVEVAYRRPGGGWCRRTVRADKAPALLTQLAEQGCETRSRAVEGV